MKNEWKFVYNNITLQSKREYLIQEWNVELLPIQQLALFGGAVRKQIPLFCFFYSEDT
jgi:hypothetical protein